MVLQFFTDPAEFLDVAGDHLAADPVVSTVVTTVTHRMVARGTARPDQRPTQLDRRVVRHRQQERRTRLE